LGTAEACDTAATENYAVVAGFTAHGAARDVQLGNLLWERAEYNGRLQRRLFGCRSDEVR
jgi:hypothetical protein